MMKIILGGIVAALAAGVTGIAQPPPWKQVDKLFERKTEIKVARLQVRLVQLDEWNWELRVSQQGRTLASRDRLTIPERADFGLFPLLAGNQPQLIVHANTGGSTPNAVCWVYTTEPVPRLVYSSEWYWRHRPCGELEVGDLDGDGNFELRHIVARWKGHEDLGYCNACGCSPCPEAIFRYDAAKRRYRPANWEFPENLKVRVEEHLRYLRGIDPKEDRIGHYYRGGWLNVVFEYLYAGSEEDAWAFMEKELGPDQCQAERGVILENLRKEPFYRETQEMRDAVGTRSARRPLH